MTRPDMTVQVEAAEPLTLRSPGGPLDQAPIRTRQVLILLTALLLAALDGYDLLSIAVVMPAISRDWHLGKAISGVMLASGLVGMAVGSLAISPFADILGRRKVVLGCLVVMTLGSLLSAVSHSVGVLAMTRVITGLGIGAMIAMTTVTAAEFSNVRRRPLVVAGVTTIGFPVGGICGGLVASALLPTVGWQPVFLVGAAAGVLLFVVVLLVVPDSPAYIIARQQSDALVTLNRVLQLLGHQHAVSLPPPPPGDRKISYRALFAPRIRATTLRLAAVNVTAAFSAYYFVNWLPQLVVDAGFPVSSGSHVSALSGVTGLFGGVAAGSIAARITPARLAACGFAGMAISMVAFGVAPNFALLLVTAGFFGFFVTAGTGMFFATVAESFPGLSRASGVGLVMGAGRIASAFGPSSAGWLFAHGLTRAEVTAGFAIPLLVAAALIAGARPGDRSPEPTDHASGVRI